MLAGDKVVWSHVPRGGYGYVVPVMATFVRRTSIERATIRVSKRDGTVVCRSVLLSNLHKPKRKGGGVLGYRLSCRSSGSRSRTSTRDCDGPVKGCPCTG